MGSLRFVAAQHLDCWDSADNVWGAKRFAFRRGHPGAPGPASRALTASANSAVRITVFCTRASRKLLYSR